MMIIDDVYVDGGIYQPAWNSSDENRNVTKDMYGIQIWPANMEDRPNWWFNNLTSGLLMFPAYTSGRV